VIKFVRQVGRELSFRSAVTVPMLYEGKAVGGIVVTRREPDHFSDADVEILRTFADHAVLAIENVRLFTEKVNWRRFPAEEKIRVLLEGILRGSRWRSSPGGKGFTPPSITRGRTTRA